MEEKEGPERERNEAVLHEGVEQDVADMMAPLPTAYALNAVMLFHVSPVFPAFSRNVRSAVL